MACGLGSFQCRAGFRLRRRRRRRAVASGEPPLPGREGPGRAGRVSSPWFCPCRRHVDGRRRRQSAVVLIYSELVEARVPTSTFAIIARHSTVLTESGQNAERDISKQRTREARIYALSRSKDKVKYAHVYSTHRTNTLLCEIASKSDR